MKKYISTALIFTTLLSAGCETAKPQGSSGNDVIPTVEQAIKISEALTKFIQATGTNKNEAENAIKFATKAGLEYVSSQKNAEKLISKSRLIEVIFEILVEEAKKTGQQIAKAELRNAAAELAAFILISVNDEKETE